MIDWKAWTTWRRWIRQVHLWVALVLCIPLALLGLTGSILVFEDELAALGQPALRASPGTAQPAGAIIAAAGAATGDRLRPTLYLAPAEAGDPATVRLAPPGRGRGPGGVEIVVDPASLAILGQRETRGGFLRQVFMLHANAMMAPQTGRSVIGWLGVAMMALAVTGLAIWWPRGGRWRAAFTVRRGARGARLHRDLHGAVGIWTLPVFMVVGLTGVYLGFPRTVGDAIASVLPARDLRGTAQAMTVTPIRGQTPADVDAVVALARAAAPDARLVSVGLPGRPNQPFRVTLAPPGHRRGAPPMTAYVDPWRRSVLELRDPATYSAGETLIAWQHALHAGAGLGPLWRGAVFLSGFLPSLFLVTGIALWLLKRRRPARG